jgi:hypothetical protein
VLVGFSVGFSCGVWFMVLLHFIATGRMTL